MRNCPPCDGLHWRVRRIDGQRFGRLVVISHAQSAGMSRAHRWLCECDCGARIVALGTSLRSGETRSCGCLKREIAKAAGDRTRTHGLSGSSTYNIWDSLRQRCTNPKRKDYPGYGGRGIRVCPRWDDFECFLEDMGPRPPGCSIERRDVNGDYTPGNCRWATAVEQARNTRANKVLQFDGSRLCLNEWAEKIGMNKNTLQARLRRGWSVGRALSTPTDGRFSRVQMS